MSSSPRYLDPRLKLVWFLPTIIALVIFWLIATLILFITQPGAVVMGFSSSLFSALLLLFLLLFIAVPVYFYNHIEYMSFTYELGDTEFIIRFGVFTRNTTVIPYNRIQNINTRRTVLERLLGLASLQIETAGTNVNASEGVLPGVSRKEELIREIMDHVEKSKANGVDGTGSPPSHRSEAQLLSDILKELVQLNVSLRKNHARPEDQPPGGNAHWPRLPPAPPSVSGRGARHP